jgi:hypothetical protein
MRLFDDYKIYRERQSPKLARKAAIKLMWAMDDELSRNAIEPGSDLHKDLKAALKIIDPFREKNGNA